MRQGLLSEPEASSGPAAMLLAVSRSPSSIPRRSPCPDRCHLPLASPSPSTHKTSTASTTASTPGAMPPSSGVPLSIPHTDRFHLSLASLYISNKTKNSPAPSKYNTTRHQRKNEQMSSGYSQSTSLLAHNRITAHRFS